MFNTDNRIKRLGFIPQKENLYNLLLVNGKDIDLESMKLLNDIKENLSKSVLLNLWNGEGVQLWCLRLQRYIEVYGLKFSKEDHIHFIVLLYEILTCTRQGLYFTQVLIDTLVPLLRKIKLLSPQELSLPWRPLYDLCDELFFRSKIFFEEYNIEELKSSMRDMVLLANNYFPVNSTKEIFELMSPLLCPHSFFEITEALTKLEWFLPTSHLVNNQHIVWFDVLITLWEACLNEVLWEETLMKLFARLSKNNIGEINWEPYISVFYSKIIQTMRLPSRHEKKRLMQSYLTPESCALWIVSTLDCKGSGKREFGMLLTLFSSYCQPSNGGPWTGWMCKMVLELSVCLVERIKHEQNEELTWLHEVPVLERLNEDDITEFVQSLLNIVIDALPANCIQSSLTRALHYLAIMRPNIIIPRVLELFTSSQEHTTEPRMYICAIECLYVIAQTLVEEVHNGNFDISGNIMELLFVCAQNIDLSNYTKSLKTLTCLIHILSLMPLISFDEIPKNSEVSNLGDLFAEKYIRLEELVGDLLSRCLGMILSVESTGNTDFEIIEQFMSENLLKYITNLMDSIGSHLSPKLFKMFFQKIKLFTFSRTLETESSTVLVAEMCRMLCKINPEETVGLFVPELAKNICSMINSEGLIGEDFLQHEVYYYLHILRGVIDCESGSWGIYIDKVCDVLDRTLTSSDRKIAELSSNILSSGFRSISCISLKNNFENYFNHKSPVLDFGLFRSINELNIEWNTPTNNTDKIHLLMNKYVSPSLECIEGFLAGTLTLKREHLHSRLRIIEASLECDQLCSFTTEIFLRLDGENSVVKEFVFDTGMDVCSVTVAKRDSLHDYVLCTLSKLQDFLLLHQEEDIESLNIIIKIWEKLINTESSYDILKSEINGRKKLINNPLRKKNLGKHIDLQLFRIRLLASARSHYSDSLFTKSHVEVLKCLLQLCLCRYRTVQEKARLPVFRAISIRRTISPLIMNIVSDYIKLNASVNKEAFEGIIKVLQGPKNCPVINYHDLEAYLLLLPELAAIKPEEEESVPLLKQLETVMNKRNFPRIIFPLVISSETLNKSALALISHKPEIQNIFTERKTNFVACTNKAKDKYLVLIHSLTQLLIEKKMNWKQEKLCLHFLYLLGIKEPKYPSSSVNIILEYFYHDNLHLRQLALNIFVIICAQEKIPLKKNRVCIQNIVGVEVDSYHYGERLDNKICQFNLHASIATQENWDESNFAKPSIGYAPWPKIVEMFAPYSEQPKLDLCCGLPCNQKIIYDYFSCKNNISSLVQKLKLKDSLYLKYFNFKLKRMFKMLFRHYESTILDYFKEAIDDLVLDPSERNQMLALEILGGIICSSKHWPFEKQLDLWAWLKYILLILLKKLPSTKSLESWRSFLISVTMRVHPNRNCWLYNLFYDEIGDNTNSLELYSRKLLSMECLMFNHQWQLEQMNNSLYDMLRDMCSSEYELIRERVAGLMAQIFVADIGHKCINETNSPKVKHFVEFVITYLENGLDFKVMKSCEDDSKKELSLCESEKSFGIIHRHEFGREHAENMIKTVALIIQDIHFIRMNPEFYRCLPFLIMLENCKNLELAKICKAAVSQLAKVLILPSCFPLVMDCLVMVTNTNHCWMDKITLIEFIEDMSLHNIAVICMNNEYVSGVVNILLKYLEDENCEVRQKAGLALSGFIHFRIIRDENKLMNHFKTLSSMGDERLKHSGIIGLCSFLRASPYHYDERLMQVFIELSKYLNFTPLIKSTIRITTREFMRTHFSQWVSIASSLASQNIDVEELIIPPEYSIYT